MKPVDTCLRCQQHRMLDPKADMHVIFDSAVLQKLLPKLHGSRTKLQPVLAKLAKSCLVGGDVKDPFKAGSDKVRWPLSYEKITRMQQRLLANGFTSFAEA